MSNHQPSTPFKGTVLPKWTVETWRIVVSSVLTGIVSAGGAMYLAGARSEAARQDLIRVSDRQLLDHESLAKLTVVTQRIVEDHEKQLALHTDAIARLKIDVVPRAEHEGHWKSDEVWKAEIKQDLREQRQDIKEILTNVKK